MILKSVLKGLLGMLTLLGLYFSLLTALSGWASALDQFNAVWYFIVSLALGFGVQIGLYGYLRGAIHRPAASGKVVAVSGTTSTAAMISCCAHYLTNVLPVLGVAGFMTLVAQYQTELFWLGLASNGAGIVYIGSKVIKFSTA